MRMEVYYQLDILSLVERLAWLLLDKLVIRGDWKKGKVLGKCNSVSHIKKKQVDCLRQLGLT